MKKSDYFCGAAGGIIGNVYRPLTTDQLPQQPEEERYLTSIRPSYLGF